MTGVMKKVFDCLPDDRVSPAELCSIISKTGSNPDLRVVAGCLNSLKTMGLVKEVWPGVFLKIEVKKPQVRTQPMPAVKQSASVVEIAPTPVAITAAPAAPETPLDRLASISKRVKQIAIEIEEIALEVESAAQSRDADAEKMAQLKAILKSLG